MSIQAGKKSSVNCSGTRYTRETTVKAVFMHRLSEKRGGRLENGKYPMLNLFFVQTTIH